MGEPPQNPDDKCGHWVSRRRTGLGEPVLLTFRFSFSSRSQAEASVALRASLDFGKLDPSCVCRSSVFLDVVPTDQNKCAFARFLESKRRWSRALNGLVLLYKFPKESQARAFVQAIELEYPGGNVDASCCQRALEEIDEGDCQLTKKQKAVVKAVLAEYRCWEVEVKRDLLPEHVSYFGDWFVDFEARLLPMAANCLLGGRPRRRRGPALRLLPGCFESGRRR
jgi:hypothetical protein